MKKKYIVTKSQSSLSGLAKLLNMTLTELIEMNPGITRLPYVPAGTPITARA